MHTHTNIGDLYFSHAAFETDVLDMATLSTRPVRHSATQGVVEWKGEFEEEIYFIVADYKDNEGVWELTGYGLCDEDDRVEDLGVDGEPDNGWEELVADHISGEVTDDDGDWLSWQGTNVGTDWDE